MMDKQDFAPLVRWIRKLVNGETDLRALVQENYMGMTDARRQKLLYDFIGLSRDAAEAARAIHRNDSDQLGRNTDQIAIQLQKIRDTLGG